MGGRVVPGLIASLLIIASVISSANRGPVTFRHWKTPQGANTGFILAKRPLTPSSHRWL